MPCGMFGKLSAKRDFITVNAPQSFLSAWEPWIEGGVTSSRLAMKEAWQDAYLTAPIWRYWIGPRASAAGTCAAGAFMSSLDGVGRFFPLTAFALAGADAMPPPPGEDMQAEWYDALEDFLLSTLDQELPYEDVTEALGKLALPAARAAPPAPPAIFRPAADVSVVALGDGSVQDALAAIRRAADEEELASMSFWWTNGGEVFPRQVFSARGMPDVSLYAHMLSSAIDAPPRTLEAAAEPQAEVEAGAEAT